MPKFKTGVCISKCTKVTAAVTAVGVSMRLRNALIALVGATLLIAGIACGGGESDEFSIDEYRSFCRELLDGFAKLQQEEGLTKGESYMAIALLGERSYTEAKEMVERCRLILED